MIYLADHFAYVGVFLLVLWLIGYFYFFVISKPSGINKRYKVYCKDRIFPIRFVGHYVRNLETNNWHYYQDAKGTIWHFRKDNIISVHGDDYKSVVRNR